MSRVGITGATGFIGSALVREFEADRWSVVEFGRRPSREGARFVSFDLDFGT